jgi:DNA-3-methyladenine glycosylase I
MQKMERCPWTTSDELMVKYHDEEWGIPVYDDVKHFEFLTLESAQAGLSWKTILHRREAYRLAFAGFDPEKVALFGVEMVDHLLQNTGIIRNRQKIEAAINNAQRFLEVQKEFGSFSAYIWGFVGGEPIQNGFRTLEELPSKTVEAERLSKDLKKRGFKFVGPVTIYAHMQAAGLVNDHLVACPCFKAVQLLVRRSE